MFFQTLPATELSRRTSVKLLWRNISRNIFQGIFHYFYGIFQWQFSKPCQYLNSVDRRDITFKLCFIIAAAANLLKPSRMFPPINYQLSVMKYLYLLWPLVHICMTDLRKLYILHFFPSGNTIKRTVAVKVGCLNFGKKSDVTVEPVRTVKTFTELL